MSIINKLGGYSRAKNYLENELISGYKKIQLKSELLEYRREHGIFEDDDLVIDGLKSNDVISYKDSYKFLGNGYVSHYIRHATPLEIQAGHRLP